MGAAVGWVTYMSGYQLIHNPDSVKCVQPPPRCARPAPSHRLSPSPSPPLPPPPPLRSLSREQRGKLFKDYEANADFIVRNQAHHVAADLGKLSVWGFERKGSDRR
jgi:hypothetical protein